jgi:gliding-associated putative ABC transporter substrate-binding component GldG
MTKKQTTTLSILILIIITLCVMVSRRLWFRLDLTKGKSYTISAVSRNLHNEIPDQIRITYYLSDKLKSIHPLPGEIEDLLREYAGFSRGKIQVTVRDPAKAKIADQVEQLGIQPQQIQTVEQDQASVITVYTGIVIEYLDQMDVLPVVFSLETLEYDLTSRIRSMVRGSSRQLGVIVGGDPRRWNDDYRQLQNAYMQAGYQLRLIADGQDIPDTLPALLVLDGVESLDETALYRIDRYIQNGGKVLFTVKGIMIDMEGSLDAKLLADKGLLDMLSTYGVTVLPEIVMDKSSLTMQYQTRTPNGATLVRITRNPQWIRILEGNGNPGHPVSARFSGLDLYWASPLTLNAPQDVDADYLFTTTAEAWSMGEPFYTNPEIPYLFERDAADTRGKKILGASLTGTFPSWFANKPKPEPEDGSELADMPLHAKNARIIVVGDTEFATSFINVSNGQRNLDFLVQVADWLCNDDDIISIRSRVSGSGRLDKIIDPAKKAAAMKFAQLVNVYIVPLLVILAGVFLALRRRAEANAKARSYAEGNSNKADGMAAGKAAGAKEHSDDL